MIKVGATLRNITRLEVGSARDYLLGSARRAEDLGLYSVWVSDHILSISNPDSEYPYNEAGKWSMAEQVGIWESTNLLSAFSAITSSIRLGISAIVLPLRHPVYTAKVAATIDCLSGGRLSLAAGVGWLRAEMEMLGFPWYQRRGSVADEQLTLIKHLWTADDPSFEGRWYQIRGAAFHPKPIQNPHPPIWVAGTSDAAIRRAVRLGTGWHGVAVSPQQVAETAKRMRIAASESGRDPDAYTLSTTHTVLIDLEASDHGPAQLIPQSSGMPALRGSPNQIARTLREYEQAGLDHFTAHYRMDGTEFSVDSANEALDIIGYKVLPALR